MLRAATLKPFWVQVGLQRGGQAAFFDKKHGKRPKEAFQPGPFFQYGADQTLNPLVSIADSRFGWHQQ
jgi:hypothetical protein